jgi:hypothetical protein
MKILKIIIIMYGLLNWLTGCNEPKSTKDFQDDKFKVGQIWKYNTRQDEENSTMTILKVEKYDSVGVVIHVYVNGLKLKSSQGPGGFYDEIGHLPLSKEAILKSVTTLVSEDNELPDFKDGYNDWKEAFDNKKAGIFSIILSDAVKYVEETMHTGKRTEN